MALFGRRARDEVPVPHELVRADDLARLRAWAEGGGGLNETDAHGRTALHVAYACANFAAVDLLTELGADAHKRDGQRQTPSQLFAELRRRPSYVLRVAVADELSRVTGFLRVTDEDDSTALHLAWAGGREDAARRLVEAGASTTATNRFGLTPSDMAAVGEYEDWLRELAESRSMPTDDHTALRQSDPRLVACALSRVVAAERRPRVVLRCGIRLGIPATVDVLVRALWSAKGDKWIATDYLNSGETTLSNEGSRWAATHSFEIVFQQSGDTARWGSPEGGHPPHLFV